MIRISLNSFYVRLVRSVNITTWECACLRIQLSPTTCAGSRMQSNLIRFFRFKHSLRKEFERRNKARRKLRFFEMELLRIWVIKFISMLNAVFLVLSQAQRKTNYARCSGCDKIFMLMKKTSVLLISELRCCLSLLSLGNVFIVKEYSQS